MCSHLLNISSTAGELNRLALEERLMFLALEANALSKYEDDPRQAARLSRFRQLSRLGKFEEAETVWGLVDTKLLAQESRAIAMHHRAVNCFFKGCLTEELLSVAESSNKSISALGVRNLCGLRGFWYLDKGDWTSAKKSLQLAVTLAHKAGKVDRRSEIRLALAKYHLGELSEPMHVIEQLSQSVDGCNHRNFADLSLAVGDRAGAMHHADAAYKWAWSDGEPYVNWYELNKTRSLLQHLGLKIPNLPHYKPIADKKFPWEDKISSVIRVLQSMPKIIAPKAVKTSTRKAPTGRRGL